MYATVFFLTHPVAVVIVHPVSAATAAAAAAAAER
jgi:hypothetical protein